ncbi:hypothetical protein ACFL6L_02440 [candidate division KSB1 bacterium]
MKITEKSLVKEHIHEIIKYRAVLSNALKKRVTLEQAAADWFEKGFADKYRQKV